MGDTDNFEDFDLGNETPQADALDQRLPVDPEHQTGVDTTHLGTTSEQDANEADLIDQATTVPTPDDPPPSA
jgi:hypothetical protein